MLREKLRRRVGTRDRGASTLWFTIFAFAFLVVAGLVVDYTGSLQAKADAQTAANEAGRAAGQSIVSPLGVRGVDVASDPIGSQIAAQTHLRRAGVQGTVTLSAGEIVNITTYQVYEPKILGIIGVGPKTVTGNATVRLNHVGADPTLEDPAGAIDTAVDAVTGLIE